MSSSSTHHVLILDGSLKASQSDSVHQRILEALDAHPSVVVDCSGADDVDITFLQILIGAARMAARSNKEIRLASPPAGPFAEALARCGFSKPNLTTTSLGKLFALSH